MLNYNCETHALSRLTLPITSFNCTS